MRIKLVLKPLHKDSSLSLNYPYSFSSLIYRIIASSSSDYADFLHNQGYKNGSKSFKFFTFSRPQIESQRVNNGRIYILSNSITWQIASPIKDFLENLVKGLFQQEEILLADDGLKNYFAVTSIEKLSSPLLQDKQTFKCLAPVTISITEIYNDKRQKVYVSPDKAIFSELIRNNLIEKWRVLYSKDPESDHLDFNFDWDFINRQGGVNKVSKLICYKDINIRGYFAPFSVSGSKELIKLGYECGFGNANSQGFGMAEVINNKELYNARNST